MPEVIEITANFSLRKCHYSSNMIATAQCMVSIYFQFIEGNYRSQMICLNVRLLRKMISMYASGWNLSTTLFERLYDFIMYYIGVIIKKTLKSTIVGTINLTICNEIVSKRVYQIVITKKRIIRSKSIGLSSEKWKKWNKWKHDIEVSLFSLTRTANVFIKEVEMEGLEKKKLEKGPRESKFYDINGS